MDSSQSVARSAKILCNDSETMAINMDTRFDDLATDTWRFLTFVYHSRIPTVPLATSLLVI
jgi:hypothetical protein